MCDQSSEGLDVMLKMPGLENGLVIDYMLIHIFC